ncbi:MAG: hypothetical protein VW907_08070 [Opitutae bacterium]
MTALPHHTASNQTTTYPNLPDRAMTALPYRVVRVDNGKVSTRIACR